LVAVIESAVVPAGLEPEALEARRHPVGGNRVLRCVGQTSLHRVGGQEKQIGPHLCGGNRLDLRGTTRLRMCADGGRQQQRDKQATHHDRPQFRESSRFQLLSSKFSSTDVHNITCADTKRA
jgi:hypothetical protein